MITPFQVYLILQLDTLNGVFITLGIACLIVMVISLIVWAAHGEAEYGNDKNTRKAAVTCIKRVSVPFLITWLLVAFCPSSKTAAAMFLLPALTSDKVMEPIGKEASELYQLAKQALKNAVEEEETPQDPPKESKDESQ